MAPTTAHLKSHRTRRRGIKKSEKTRDIMCSNSTFWFRTCHSFCRAWRQEWRAARLHRGLKLHQFRPNSVRVVQVELPLAVAPYLRRRVLGPKPITFVEQGDRLPHVLDTQRE